MDLAMKDNTLAWDLRADGRYVQRTPEPGEEIRDLHRILMEEAKQQGFDRETRPVSAGS